MRREKAQEEDLRRGPYPREGAWLRCEGLQEAHSEYGGLNGVKWLVGVGVLYFLEALVAIFWPHNDKTLLGQGARALRIAGSMVVIAVGVGFLEG